MKNKSCDYCRSTEVKEIYGALLCKRCADDAGVICRECGGLNFISSLDGPTMCMDCRSVESDTSIDWDEAKGHDDDEG
jgi:hypothetical protein